MLVEQHEFTQAVQQPSTVYLGRPEQGLHGYPAYMLLLRQLVVRCECMYNCLSQN